MPEARTKVKFLRPQNPSPTFANATLVNSVGSELFLEFAFIDPLAIGEAQEVAENTEEVEVEARIVARLAINPEAAKILIQQLQQELSNKEELNNG